MPTRRNGRNSKTSTKKKKRRGWYKIVRQSRPVRMVARRLPRQAKRPLKAARKWQRERAESLRFRWRRSLQLRVVTTTLALSALVIAVLGFFLTQQISDGLLQNKEKSATAQVSQGLTVAESNVNLNKVPTSAAIANNFLYPTAQDLQNASGNNSSYIVVIEVNAKQVKSPVYTEGVSGGADPASIPAALAASVESEQDHDAGGKVYYAPTTIVSTLGRGNEPGLAVGTPLGSYYQLYYLFPMVQEQQTLSLVQRTLVGAGLALIVLLALIASLVTRWVVIPVRHAAQAAQRLSAGRLGERMQVRGADDLAALATSFNDMAASLQDKLRELEELSQLQRQFVSDVSHELRTPLTTIKMAADVLLDSKDSFDAAGARSAELLQGQLDRFQALLEDLLEISRYDANAATLDPDSVDISDIARRAADDAQQLAERRGSRIEFRLPAEPCMAEADHRRVERILRNLLVNAVEHGEGNDVIVTVAADRDAVAVAVRDHGVGLKPGQDVLVFDRFWRADPARARTTGGTGLGLAIALEDAQLHGGWLQAWGMPGKGSVFRLTIPRSAGQKLVGSPLPLVPDDTDAISALGEIMPNGLLLPGQPVPPAGANGAAAPATEATDA
ncbi:MAG TPA: MtrAB system histidine kinase MtrB [Streptosporangiaceae bacterium]|nr:MtrAB system histidine kinase MtrB [Streptosporangiaceae bacterium]